MHRSATSKLLSRVASKLGVCDSKLESSTIEFETFKSNRNQQNFLVVTLQKSISMDFWPKSFVDFCWT